MFQSGEDALSTIGMEIEKAVKEEFEEETCDNDDDSPQNDLK